MKVSVRGTTFDLDNEHVPYSPMLYTMMGTDLPVDMDNGAYILDVDPDAFNEYIKFLRGDRFYMDPGAAELFDYMGHPNTMNYPLDVWAMKLRGDRIRGKISVRGMRDIRDLLLHLNIINDEEYDEMANLKNLYMESGYVTYVFYLNADFSSAYNRWRSKGKRTSSFGGDNGRRPYPELRNYITDHGERYSGGSLYIIGDIVCVYVPGKAGTDRIALYRRDTIKVVTKCHVNNNILTQDMWEDVANR